MSEAKCGRCGVPIGEGTKQTQWYFEPDETAFCRECAMAHVVSEHETIAEFEVEIKKLRERVTALEKLCGEAEPWVRGVNEPEAGPLSDKLQAAAAGKEV